MSLLDRARNSDHPAEPLSSSERSLFIIVCILLVLNLLDAIFTIGWIEWGAATEANPVMAVLLQNGPVPFVIVKTVLVSAGSYLLWVRRKRPLSVVAVTLLFLAYYYLLLFHLRALRLNLLDRVMAWLETLG